MFGKYVIDDLFPRPRKNLPDFLWVMPSGNMIALII